MKINADDNETIQHEMLDSVLKNIKEGIVAVNEKGECLVFNAAAEKILGRLPESLFPDQWSKPFGVFLPDRTTPLSAKDHPLGKAVQGEETHDIEMFLKNASHPDGIWVVVSGKPFLDEKGNHRGGMAIFRDITGQKQMEEQKTYTQALEASNRDLQDFIFVASHDLQEPLRKIQSFCNFLKEEAGPDLNVTAASYLLRVQDATRRMSILIEDLLQLTRVTTKAKPFESLDLREIIREVRADIEIRLRETRGKVEVGELPKLEADPAQMRQLFQNLISNSLKYHKKDIPPIVIVEGKTDVEEGWCRIWVKDNGIGFEQKYSEKIFNIFQRLHGNGEYEGTGIGLAICRKVVERHRGTITASSQPGEGAIFEIKLPLHQIKK